MARRVELEGDECGVAAFASGRQIRLGDRLVILDCGLPITVKVAGFEIDGRPIAEDDQTGVFHVYEVVKWLS